MNWQTILAGLVVAMAACWLVRRCWRIVVTGSRDGAGHVTGCGLCDKNPEAATTTPLVQIDAKRKP